MESSFLFRGANISYSTKGKGRNILFVHGFLGAKELWHSYQKRLSERYRVIAVDLAGHGKSEPIGYLHNMELLADSIKELFNHLNIRKVFLIGHSLGGYVSLAFAEKYPDQLSGLVLMNSSAKGDSKDRISSRNQLISLVKKDKSRALSLLVPSFFNIKKRNTHWQIKKYLKFAHQCSERSIIATIEGMKVRHEREIILKFAPFPYLYIIGEKDSILNANKLIAESNLNENGSFTVLKDVSHMSFMEAEEKVFRSIYLFIKEN